MQRTEGLTSIVVVCYNNPPITRRCIAAIERHSTSCELILIDNASPDGAGAVLEACVDRHIVVHNASNLGYAPAVNQGIALARGDTIAILNNDVIVTPGWLDAMKLHCRPDQVVVPLSTACYHGQEVQGVDVQVNDDELARIAKDVRRANADNCKTLNFAAGFCMLMDWRTLAEVGWLDPDLTLAADDFEFALRMHRAGVRFALALGVVVLHLGHRAFASDPEHADAMASASWLAFSRKYPNVLMSDFESEFRADGGPAYIYTP
ncbi:MAG: glycosyltransferase [Firmicutes bacterium]|nr:glycosyltransferase [Bacillota bacterium]